MSSRTSPRPLRVGDPPGSFDVARRTCAAGMGCATVEGLALLGSARAGVTDSRALSACGDEGQSLHSQRTAWETSMYARMCMDVHIGSRFPMCVAAARTRMTRRSNSQGMQMWTHWGGECD